MRGVSFNRWRVMLLTCGFAIGTAAGGQKGQRVSIPVGTEIQVRMMTKLETGEAQAGQTFSGTVAKPVVAGGRTLVAPGTKVSGRVVEAVSSGRLKRPASITLELSQAGASSLRSQPLRIDGKSHLLRNVGLIGGGAAAGAILGGLAEGKKGAAIGAAIGAGAGTAAAFLTGKNEIQIPAEAVLPFVVGGGGAAVPTTTAVATRRDAGEPDAGEAYREAPAPGGGAAGVLVFSGRDQDMIRNYFVSNRRGMPPGLAKKGGLPPGLAKKLRRGGTLPPGWQKKYGGEPFPVDLDQRLPRLPSGYSRLLIAGRAVILNRENRILDLMAVVQR